MLILRLLMHYKYQEAAALHNLLFLVSAACSEEQALGFYDFVRRRTGAYSCSLQRVFDELIAEGLVQKGENGFQLTEKGKHIYRNLGGTLRAFPGFWEQCSSIMQRCREAEQIKERVFYNITFRRAKIGERIFDYSLF